MKLAPVLNVNEPQFLYLFQLIGAEVLPIIEALNPSDRNFVPFYRSVYGLLCHCGHLYPSVITDNVDNSSEEDVT